MNSYVYARCDGVTVTREFAVGREDGGRKKRRGEKEIYPKLYSTFE